MAHHGEDSYAIRNLFKADEDLGLGATGQYPRGRLNDDDEGEIKMAVAADKANGVIVIDFGKPTAWIGFTADQAVELADLIHKKAWELRGIS